MSCTYGQRAGTYEYAEGKTARDAGGEPEGLGVMGTEGRKRRGEGMVTGISGARRTEEDKAMTLSSFSLVLNVTAVDLVPRDGG